MRIDAHQHFWRLSRGDYDWLTPELGEIRRDFLPGDLAPLIAAAGVERTILVQAAATEAETRFLLEVASRTPFVAGVVGWTDFDAADAARRIEGLAGTPGLLGLRPMVQDLEDDAWLLRPSLAPAFEAMVRGGLRFDALVKPRHLEVLRRFLDLYPDLKVVIDHGAKPDIAGGGLAGWAGALRTLDGEDRVFCKLSGLVTEARAGWRTSDLVPYVQTLFESFGPDRLMWGSDWPVLNLNGDYASWWGAAVALARALPPDARARLFGGAAAEFYGIEA